MGTDALSHAFIESGEQSYDIGQMFDEDEIQELPGPDNDPDPEYIKGPEEGKEEKKVASSGKWYENIPGIDPATGIQNSGSEDTYLTVVSTFFESMEDDRDAIDAYYEAQDWKNYTTKVHSLKSTAMLVGAAELAEEARALEMAGKSGDIDFIKENNAKTLEHLMSFKALLAKALAGDDKEGAADYDDMLTESIYEALRAGAAEHDDELISETFEDAEDYTFSEEDTDKLSRLKELYGAHEYEKMTELLG